MFIRSCYTRVIHKHLNNRNLPIFSQIISEMSLYLVLFFRIGPQKGTFAVNKQKLCFAMTGQSV